MMPERVGPVKLPRAKKEVKRPEMTVWTSIHSGNPAATAALWAHPKDATRTAALPRPWED